MTLSKIAKAHPFDDGNKRTAFMAADIFLSSNRHSLIASENEVVVFALAHAASKISEADFAAWLERNSEAI